LISVARLAFCGTTGQITFAFPFTEFLPLEQKIAFTANVRHTSLSHYKCFCMHLYLSASVSVFAYSWLTFGICCYGVHRWIGSWLVVMLHSVAYNSWSM